MNFRHFFLTGIRNMSFLALPFFVVSYLQLCSFQDNSFRLFIEFIIFDNQLQQVFGFIRASPGWNSEAAHPACRKRQLFGTHQ